MMDREVLSYSLSSLKEAGADRAQCVLSRTKKYEMNVAGGEISLLRTNIDVEFKMTLIKEGKKGDITINKTDKDSVDRAIEGVIELSKTAQADDAYDIAPYQQPEEFMAGDEEPDLDKTHGLLKDFAHRAKERYPKILISEAYLEFNHGVKYFVNSNGVEFKSTKGVYRFACVFSSKDGGKSSSFNYTGCSLKNLEKDLLDCGTIDSLLKQSVEQLDTKSLEGKFVGEIIITPDCLKDIIEFYIETYLSDRSLISGTSLLKDKLNKDVASQKLTLSSKPVSEEISDGYCFTPEGFKAENVTIIDRGVLKSFMLSLYGANKTKMERARNSGGCYVVEGGEKSLKEIIKSIDKGILVSRYSGGMPSLNGDFSGVAKNSYFIENGQIKYPISETMISGNLNQLFNDIKEISNERIDFGTSVLPWMCCGGITISGK